MFHHIVCLCIISIQRKKEGEGGGLGQCYFYTKEREQERLVWRSGGPWFPIVNWMHELEREGDKGGRPTPLTLYG